MLTSRTLFSLTVLIAVAACRAPFEPVTLTPPPPPPPPPTTSLLPLRIGSTGADFARTVGTDAAGNAYVAGQFSGTVDFDAGSGATAKIASGSSDIAVAKYAPDGTFQWVFSIGGSDDDAPYGVAVSADGAVYLAGYASAGALCSGSLLPNAGGRDILLARISAAGTCDWAVSIGGSGDDEARDITLDANGNIVITGLFSGSVDFDPGAGATILISRGGTDGFVARYAPDGSFIDAAQFGGPDGDDAGTAVAATSDGGVAVAGTFSATATFGAEGTSVVQTSEGGLDFFVARYNSSLALQWASRGGGSGDDIVGAGGLIAGSDDNVYVTGTFSGVADLGPSIGGQPITSVGGADVFVTRYTATGAWGGFAVTFGGAGTETVGAFARDDAGNLYLGGSFQGTVDFDPGAGSHIITAQATAGAADAYLLSITPAGDLRWVDPFTAANTGDGLAASVAHVALAGDGSLWAVGQFYGTVDFDPDSGAVVRQSAGDADQFIARYLQATGGLTGR